MYESLIGTKNGHFREVFFGGRFVSVVVQTSVIPYLFLS